MTPDLIREPGTSVGFVRPMFEVLPDAADANGNWADAARWPEPWPFHDLGEEA